MDLSFDTNRTKAILIGSTEYDNFDDIPPIQNNLLEFKRILGNQNIIGIPEDGNINIIDNYDNNKTFDQIVRILEDENNIEFDTLIFYYVGHGYREKRKKELYLASKNSNKRNRYSFIKFAHIKEELEISHFRNLIIIIDACHSGLAAQDEGIEKLTSDEITINKGAYVIASSPANEKSFFDKDNQYTFFTGEFLEIINKGIDERKEVIQLEKVYQNLYTSLKRKNLPEPQRKSTMRFQDFYFCKNIKSPYLKQKEAEKLEKKKNEYEEFFEFCYDNNFEINARQRKRLKSEQLRLQLADSDIKLIEQNVIHSLNEKREKLISENIEKIQAEDWEICYSENTIEAYKKFTNKYKVGKYVEKAYIQINILIEEERRKERERIELAKQKSDYEKVVIENSIEEYKKFIGQYKKGALVDDIEVRFRELKRVEDDKKSWSKVKQTDSINSYETYLVNHPNGIFCQEALNRIKEIKQKFEQQDESKQIEKSDYEKAISINTILAYTKFIDKYKKGELINDVKYRLSELEKDKDSWLKAKQIDRISSYKTYLASYPKGIYFKQAQNRIKDIKQKSLSESGQKEKSDYEEACKLNTVDGYNNFLFNFPNSIFSINAREAINKIIKETKEWGKAKRIHKLKHYQSFIERYPLSNHIEEAKAKIHKIKQNGIKLRIIIISISIILLMCLGFVIMNTEKFPANYTVNNPGGKLHLRESNSQESKSLGMYDHGTSVKVYDIDGDWAEVYLDIDGKHGYMGVHYLRKVTDGHTP